MPDPHSPTDRFLYEVAFSFLSAYEATALQVSDSLLDRLTTFVYSQKQPHVVGTNTDGVDAFSNVFRYESRVCVILHSEGWGRKGYTHIEEGAMKERGVKEGWDFLLVVRLDDSIPPKWIPTTKVWYGFAKYGMEGLVATIDNRVTELGGRPKEDSVLEKAARLERERAFEDKQQLFLRSTDGFRRARQEVENLRNLLKLRVGKLAAVSPSLDLRFDSSDITFLSGAAISARSSFAFYWQPQYANSLTGAALHVVEWAGRFSYHGMGGGPQKRGFVDAIPSVDYADRVVWQVDERSKILTSEQLIDYLLTRLLEPDVGPQIFFL